VLYTILIVFEVLMKLVRLIKMCLNETYNKFRTDKQLSEMFTFGCCILLRSYLTGSL
jgi:hypothetical protein